MTDKKVVPKYTKEQFINAKNAAFNKDVLSCVLEDDKEYSFEEAEKLIKGFLNHKEVK